MTYIFCIAITAILSGMCVYGFFYQREKKLIQTLQNMITSAKDGTLTRGNISEERLSALENSLKRYLDDSMLSQMNQEEQKALIQGLISDISHQTLTPISNLKIYSELLSEQLDNGKEGSDALDEIVNTICEQTEKLEFLIQSLVKFSRMEQGIITVHPKPTPIRELLEPLKKQYEARAKEKQIELDIYETDLHASFDLKWTSEALVNLLDNAVKYTKEGGSIQVRVTSYSLFIRIDVADTGIGIAKDEIPLLFSRFFRGISVTEEEGVGIGLFLAREIIQAQKGYIKVQSAPQKGSTFSVFLPK